ncbi:hypothetical protein [Actinomadura alba]|uniref:Uncharacterized protein n=1 Tax=Actinomadura alba TaxID=406431 RepID=A0ABR7LWK5_9ACTN|nr:hypothetical protein [Actinomadura alba]MBC6469231.1 hypothetical protein [Actinomadura alba]
MGDIAFGSVRPLWAHPSRAMVRTELISGDLSIVPNGCHLDAAVVIFMTAPAAAAGKVLIPDE